MKHSISQLLMLSFVAWFACVSVASAAGIGCCCLQSLMQSLPSASAMPCHQQAQTLSKQASKSAMHGMKCGSFSCVKLPLAYQSAASIQPAVPMSVQAVDQVNLAFQSLIPDILLSPPRV